MTTTDFTEEEVQTMLDNLDNYSDEIIEINRIVDELESRKNNEAAYNDLRIKSHDA